jgi:hypothetical protein
MTTTNTTAPPPPPRRHHLHHHHHQQQPLDANVRFQVFMARVTKKIIFWK